MTDDELQILIRRRYEYRLSVLPAGAMDKLFHATVLVGLKNDILKVSRGRPGLSLRRHPDHGYTLNPEFPDGVKPSWREPQNKGGRKDIHSVHCPPSLVAST